MYRVYRDPEGERYLDQNSYKTEPDGNASHQFSEEDYKKRIQNLNIEIKGLNERLEKVSSFINFVAFSKACVKS